jgi:hypothetical protein
MRFEHSIAGELRDTRKHLGKEDASAHEKLVSSLQDLAFEIRRTFEQRTLELLTQTRHIAPALRRSIQERQLFAPITELYDTPRTIRERLANLSLEDAPTNIDSSEVLFLFHLPKALRQYELLSHNWRRENILGLLGEAYSRGLHAFWDAFNAYTKTHSVEIQRLNKRRLHENRPEGYYYVFLLSPKKMMIPAAPKPESAIEQPKEPAAPVKIRLSQRSLKKRARQAHWRTVSRSDDPSNMGAETQKTHSQLQADQ